MKKASAFPWFSLQFSLKTLLKRIGTLKKSLSGNNNWEGAVCDKIPRQNTLRYELSAVNIDGVETPLKELQGNATRLWGFLSLFTLPSWKVPPTLLLKKTFFKESDKKMGGIFKERGGKVF